MVHILARGCLPHQAHVGQLAAKHDVHGVEVIDIALRSAKDIYRAAFMLR